MKYLVTAEVTALHQAVVEAESEDQAADAYLGGEWVEDKGETFDDNSALILTVEEIK